VVGGRQALELSVGRIVRGQIAVDEKIVGQRGWIDGGQRLAGIGRGVLRARQPAEAEAEEPRDGGDQGAPVHGDQCAAPTNRSPATSRSRGRAYASDHGRGNVSLGDRRATPSELFRGRLTTPGSCGSVCSAPGRLFCLASRWPPRSVAS